MTVRRGDRGDEVARVQTLLNEASSQFMLAVDGRFGAYTDDAVRGFQLVTGLVVDGVVGPITLAALLDERWNDVIETTRVQLPQRRIDLSESVSFGGAPVDLLRVDVRCYGMVEAERYSTTRLNDGLERLAQSWIADLRSHAEPVGPGTLPNELTGELEVTMLTPTLASATGVLDWTLAGAAHPSDRIVSVTMDLAADRILSPREFFMNDDWPDLLWGYLLIHGFSPVVDRTPEQFQHTVLTATGVSVLLDPSQVGLPLAAGVQIVEVPWHKLEDLPRPSMRARASFDFGVTGPGPRGLLIHPDDVDV